MLRKVAGYLFAGVIGIVPMALRADADTSLGDPAALDGFVRDLSDICFSDSFDSYGDYESAFLDDGWNYIAFAPAPQWFAQIESDTMFVAALMKFLDERQYGGDLANPDVHAAARQMRRQHLDHYRTIFDEAKASGAAPRTKGGHQLAYFHRGPHLLTFTLYANGTPFCEFLSLRSKPLPEDAFEDVMLAHDKAGWRESRMVRIAENRFIVVKDIEPATFKDQLDLGALSARQSIQFMQSHPKPTATE